MSTRKRTLRRLAVFAVLTAAYPLAILGYVYHHTLTSGLPGGRHGPQDAYRHTLASAVVAYTLSPRVVAAATRVMERGGGASNRMDRRNNAIGAAIGARATSFSEVHQRVLEQVRNGGVNVADSGQVTWLPPHRWRKRLL